MNALVRPRGLIGSVRTEVDDRDPAVVLADLKKAVQNFQACESKRIDKIESDVNAISNTVDAVTNRQVGMIVAGEPAAAADFGTGPIVQPFTNKRPAVNASVLRRDLVALNKALRGNPSALMEVRAEMQVGSNPGGGYLVTPTISQTINQKLFDQSPMRQLCRTETITTGDKFEEPYDFSDIAAVWAGERQPRPETTGPKLGTTSLSAEEIYAMVEVTQRLLDDSDFDIASYLERRAVDKFGRSEGTAFISGDGVGKPRGLLTLPTSTDADDVRPFGTLRYVPTGDASGFVTDSGTAGPADCLKQLVWSLRAVYRQGSVFMMNSNTAAAIDKIRDSQGRYIWRESMIAGQPPALLGYPVAFNEDMPDIGANAFPIAFGRFDLAYLILDKPNSMRLTRDPFTARPNVVFYWYARCGGTPVNTEAVRLLKVAEE